MGMSFLPGLENREPFCLGELTVTFDGETAVVAAPGGIPGEQVPATEDALRARVRSDDRGRYRPLSGARTLPGGWHATCGSAAALETALDVIYPLAVTHARQHASGELRVAGLDEVLARQSGRYAAASDLSPAGRELAADELCDRCVRTPVWRDENPGPSVIPCPEPCSVLVALCREAAFWEDAPPASAPIDPGIPFAGFEAPGNEVRERYLIRAAQRAAST